MTNFLEAALCIENSREKIHIASKMLTVVVNIKKLEDVKKKKSEQPKLDHFIRLIFVFVLNFLSIRDVKVKIICVLLPVDELSSHWRMRGGCEAPSGAKWLVKN